MLSIYKMTRGDYLCQLFCKIYSYFIGCLKGCQTSVEIHFTFLKASAFPSPILLNIALASRQNSSKSSVKEWNIPIHRLGILQFWCSFLVIYGDSWFSRSIHLTKSFHQNDDTFIFGYSVFVPSGCALVLMWYEDLLRDKFAIGFRSHLFGLPPSYNTCPWRHCMPSRITISFSPIRIVQ